MKNLIFIIKLKENIHGFIKLWVLLIIIFTVLITILDFKPDRKILITLGALVISLLIILIIISCIHFSYKIFNKNKLRKSNGIRTILISRGFFEKSLNEKNHFARLPAGQSSNVNYRSFKFLKRLESYAVPISIGNPNQVTPNTICINSSDKDWERNFLYVAKRVTCILLLPSIKTGVFKEMKILRGNNLLYKTLVYMPSDVFQKEWEKINDDLEKYYYSLPKYNNFGMFYLPKNDFSAAKKYEFRLFFSTKTKRLLHILENEIKISEKSFLNVLLKDKEIKKSIIY